MSGFADSHLKGYHEKRDFNRTPEPSGGERASGNALRFVVQKHAARRLHYDLRLEMEGVLRSWAVPKGPSLDPQIRSLAVHVEDHPLEYGSFEGAIPQGEYGGGTVMLWDRGIWGPEGDPVERYRKGKLKIRLEGEKLRGLWMLFQMSGSAGENGKNWLLQKIDDKEARAIDEFDVLEERPESVASGRTMEEIADDPEHLWSARDDENAAPREQISLPDPPDAPVAKRLPETIEPQLATAVRDAPQGEDWLHELKLDGYRLIARVTEGSVRLFTRAGNDWTDRFPTIEEALTAMPVDTMMDGELVVTLSDGTTDFQALQNTIKGESSNRLIYYLFDLPYYAGHDMRGQPLVERKAYLEKLIAELNADGTIRYSDHIPGHGEGVYHHACRHALEGIISKRKRAPYTSGRTTSWLKTKCLRRQEFVVGGWTDPGGPRTGFGALLLGYYDGRGRLKYAGRVGTGFNDASLQDISERLDEIGSNTPPFDQPPTGVDARGVHWVQPTLVAEAEFTSWTNDGRLRHASFMGLREDKPPHEVRREEPADEAAQAADSSTSHNSTSNDRSNVVAGVTLSNPGRVLYPEQGVTKRILAEYVADFSEWILPHVTGRPLTLVRCPRGEGDECFYQKHLTESMPEEVLGVEVQEEGEETTLYATVDDAAGLVALVQMGVLELHPWGSRSDRLDRPDRLIFDLDPGEEVSWSAVVEAARKVGDRLDQLGLESFVRATGGKGLHVVAPLVRRSSWQEVKSFAKGVADEFAREDPSQFVATASKAKRKGKVFVDYLRNGRGATAVASYSPRARASAPVCTPIRWDELNNLKGAAEYTVSNIRQRLRALDADPWEGFADVRQSITKAMMKDVS